MIRASDDVDAGGDDGGGAAGRGGDRSGAAEGYADGGGGDDGVRRGRRARRRCRARRWLVGLLLQAGIRRTRTRFLREGVDPALRAAPALAARDLHRAAHPLIVIAAELIVKSKSIVRTRTSHMGLPD